MTSCGGCGRPLVVKSSVNRCVWCGRKKRRFQSAQTSWTYRGAIKKANKAATKQRDAEAKRIAKTYKDEFATPPVEGMTWQIAEAVARDWMKKNGYRDAKLTGSGADGGVDVSSTRAVAQVKHHAKAVGLAEVQRIHGIAVAERKKALIFSSAGFSSTAQAWARSHGVECYRFPPVRRLR